MAISYISNSPIEYTPAEPVHYSSGGGGSEYVDSMSTGGDIIVTSAGTAIQGPNLSSVRGILVVADAQNSGSIYVGGVNVTNGSGNSRGIILVPGGMSSQLLPINNARLIWINADNSGDRAGIIVI